MLRNTRARIVRALAMLAVALVGVTALAAVDATPAEAAITSPFTQVFSTNKNGDIAIAANTLMTCAASTACSTVQNSTTSIGSPVNADQNNNQTGTFVNQFPGAGIFNSSAATLTVPTDGSVLFAALVWGGRTAATGGTGNAQAALRENVRFTTPDGVTHPLVGAVSANTGTGNVGYQGYIEVTDLVSAAGTGAYRVSNVQSISGGNDNYAGWALVVALGDPNLPMRNLTIFRGFGVIQNSPASDRTATFSINGFLTPPTGPVRTTIGAVVYEGDRGLGGDSLSVGSTALSDALNPATDVFNSTISNRGVMATGRTPSYNNQLGFDADLIQAPDNTVPNGATSANITVTTSLETFYPGVITFATDLYDPKLTGVKTSTQLTDANSDGRIQVGDTLRYSVEVKNEGLDTAAASTFFDAIPTGTDYIPGSLRLNGAPLTDAAGDDRGTYATGPNGGSVSVNLGSGGSATAGGDIPLYNPSNPTDNVHTVTFDVTVNSSAVPNQGIVNAANLRYRGKTTQASSASVSNATSDVVPGPPAPANQPPVAPGRVVAMTPTLANPSITVNLLTGTSDPESQAVSVVEITDPAAGTAVLNPNGTVTYTPGPDFAGRDVISYTVQDAAGNRTTNLLRIDVNNLPPVAVNDARNVSHSAPTVVNVLGNDTDGNGDALHVRSITVNGTTITGSGSGTTAIGGTVALAGGVVTYTPPTGGLPVGNTDSFTYIAQDARGGVSNSATATLTSTNSAPVANNDSYPALPATPTGIDPRTNDTDADGDALTITTFTQPTNGSVTQLPDGTLQYTSNTGHTGTDTFQYTISDGVTTRQATVTMNVAKTPTTVGLTVSPASVPYGSSSTLTASGVPTGAGGTIQFRDADGNVLCTATPASPSCTTSTTLGVGSYQVTAVYSGDATHDAGTSPARPLTVTQRTSTLVAAISDPSISWGDTSTVSVTGVPAGATGTVTYRDQNGATICTATAAPWSCDTSSTLAVGEYDIVATYSGDANNATSTSSSVHLSVTRIVTAITETVSPSSISYGSTSTLTAGSVPAGATGTVVFTDADGDVLCTVTAAPWQCATSTTLPVGSYAITATYSGDARYAGSAAGPQPLTVTRAATAIGSTISDPSISYTDTTTLTATNVPAAATGTIEFRDADGDVLCSVTLPALSCDTAPTLPGGSYEITAVYSGDARFAGSSAPALDLEVTPAPTNVTAAVHDASVPYGTADTLTANNLPAAATGVVRFELSDGTVLCTTTLPATSCDTSTSLAPGTYSVVAVYPGDGNFAASTSAPVVFEVVRATLAVETTVGNGGTTAFGTPVSLTATGIPAGATGTVEFRDADGDLLCIATLPSLSCDTSAGLPAGSYQVTATYSGDANYQSATEATPAALTVTRQATAVVASVSDGGSVPFGTPATLTASGLPASATGTVEFRDQGGALICSTTLPALSCQTSATLPVGDYQITATYSGDANHMGSTSAPVDLEVTPATGAITVTTGGSTVYGTAADLTVHGLPSSATGTVEFRLPDGTVLCSVTLPDVSCAAPAGLAVGDYDIVAVYAGDTNHAGRTSVSAPLTVTPMPTAVVATAPDGATGTFGTPIRVVPTGLPSGATGTVEFRLPDGTVLCTLTLPDADCDLPADLDAGTYQVVAVYSGDANHAGSTSAPIAIRVTPQPTAVVATAPATAKAGTTVTLTATGIPAGSTGTVQFVTSTGTVLCTATLPALSCQTPALSAGTYTITPRYSGDTNHAASNGTPIVLTVSAGASALALTGSTVMPVLGLALLLLLAGAGFAMVGRRRAA